MTQSAPPLRHLTLWWSAATIVGSAIGALVPPAFFALSGRGTAAPFGARDVGLYIVAYCAGGAALGGAQALVVRRYLPAAGAVPWLLTTTFGAGIGIGLGMTVVPGIGTAVGTLIERVYGSAAATVVSGTLTNVLFDSARLAATATMQWLLLRLVVPATARWIRVAALGGAAAGGAFGLVLHVGMVLSDPSGNSFPSTGLSWVGAGVSVVGQLAVAVWMARTLTQLVGGTRLPPEDTHALHQSDSGIHPP